MLSALRISQRLPISFVCIGLLLSAVIGAGVYSLKRVADDFVQYAAISTNVQRVLTLDQDFSEARRNVLQISTGMQEARAAADRHFAQFDQTADLLIRDVTSDQRRQLLRQVRTAVGEYQAGARRVAELRQERDTLLTNTMDVLGPRLRTTLIETNGANLSGRADVQSYVESLNALLTMRIVAFRMMAGDLAQGERTLQLADEAGRHLTSLRAARAGEERTGLDRIVTDLAGYRTAVARYRELLVETNELVNVRMRQQAESIASTLTEIVRSQAASLDQIRQDAEATVTFGSQTMYAVGAASLLIAAALAFFLVRGITGPLGQLAGAMRRLASGDSSGAVPGLNRRDEIRAMAEALAVFQDNAKALERAEFEKREQEARVAAERRRMMAELGAAVGSVVDAASHGDFSRRVEARFDDEELTRLGEGLNLLVGTVQGSLDDLMTVMQALGAGDLTTRVDKDYEGAFGVLASGTNGTAEKLAEVIGRIGQAAATLDSAASEILAGANDLAHRTSTQAAMVEETAAAVEEFSTTVQSNASRASRASELARGAEARAQEGSVVMNEAQSAMSRIDEASARISEVVGVIENIAFQTNLLALNASVEAARAGEAGRGFAVVASEVRRLAQHASQASTEVKSLISTSVSEVRSGVELVTKAGGSLQAIVGAINEVTSLMVEIAGASKEQAITINEIGSAVRKLDEMTQQNAALVEETNSAIHMTEQQVNALNGTVGEFRLAAGGRALRKVA